MALPVGTRVGPYEVLSPLGAGGMGEVYRARDTNLNRNVALKILPESFAADADRVARFKREAQVLASLNHPNIATIYRLTETTSEVVFRALVTELVEGDDLSALIARGPIPWSNAQPIARQIIDALETAHDDRRVLSEAAAQGTPDAGLTEIHVVLNWASQLGRR